MEDLRYKYEQRPITEAEAHVVRNRVIDQYTEEIAYRKSQIEQCEKRIAELRVEPLATHIEIQITLKPGDDGYDEAPPTFSPKQYQGDFKWVNR